VKRLEIPTPEFLSTSPWALPEKAHFENYHRLKQSQGRRLFLQQYLRGDRRRSRLCPRLRLRGLCHRSHPVQDQ